MEWSGMVWLDPGKQHSKGAGRWSCYLSYPAKVLTLIFNCTTAFTFYTPVQNNVTHFCNGLCITVAGEGIPHTVWANWVYAIHCMSKQAPAGDCERSKQWPVKACKQRHRLLMVQKQKGNLLFKNELAIHIDINFWRGCQHYSYAYLLIQLFINDCSSFFF